MNGFEAVLAFFGMVFFVGFFAIFTEHKQKMAKIKADSQQKAGREVLEAIQAIRQEVSELRDTATKYDLSFDTALQRLEGRVSGIERRMAAAQPQTAGDQVAAGTMGR